MITLDDYVSLTGLDAPDACAFPAMLTAAEELLHARTLQQFRRGDLPELPLTIFKRALALQVAFMDSRGGLDGWGDPAATASGVTLGRFSVHGGASSDKAAARELLAPAAVALLPTLMAYARSWMGGEAP